jgi:hypothetical protein
MLNLRHPSYYQIANTFHFFALNLNTSPSNVTVALSLVQSPPYYATHDIFGVSLEKIVLLHLYLQVLNSRVYRAHIIPIQLTCLLSIFLLFSPSRHHLHHRHHILPASPLPSNAHFLISDVYKCLCSFHNIKSVGPDGIQGDFDLF